MSGSTRTFQKVLSAMFLSCGLASINQSVLVSVIGEMAIARRQINRSKKMSAIERPPEVDKCPPSNIPGIASKMEENESNMLWKESRDQEMH